MRQILASLYCLPKLVNGKVAILSGDKSRYKLFTVPRTVTIADDYDPLNYVLLTGSKWGDIIVYSTSTERVTFLVNQQLIHNKFPRFVEGDRVHLHSRNGMYTIVKVYPETRVFTATCNKWSEGQMLMVDFSDFKCLAGGINKPRC